MPYRIHLRDADDATFDRLVELGALDIESDGDRDLTALMPDGVTPSQVARALAREHVRVSSAVARDGGSTWILNPRPFRIGRLQIAPADAGAAPGLVRLLDTRAFGTGLHATTALCVELLDELAQPNAPGGVLDVGTGSGVLALAALALGVPRAVAIDIDGEAVQAAAANAVLNGVPARMPIVRGGPDALAAAWPLVLANVLAAPLIEMAPSLVRRVGHHGRLVLSGVPRSVEPDVARAYRRLGMRHVDSRARANWVALLMQATW